ncbi:MAG: sugar phosphate nucleotidyltransferase [Candidatus Beckwithbacteria bacterium]
MKIIIPMAGFGTRFGQKDTIKPFIDVLGKPMIFWAVTKSFPQVKVEDFVFIILKEHQTKYQVKEKLRQLFGSKIKVVIIPRPTRGAAETALAAKISVDPQEEIIIADSDQFIDSNPLFKAIKHKKADASGITLVDRPIDKTNKYSYALADNHNLALAVAEKDPVLAAQGAYANTGAYYFSKAKIFFQAIETMIKNNNLSGPTDRQEFFVAPVYQQLINEGKKVYVALGSGAWRLGTPEDLSYFLSHYR